MSNANVHAARVVFTGPAVMNAAANVTRVALAVRSGKTTVCASAAEKAELEMEKALGALRRAEKALIKGVE